MYRFLLLFLLIFELALGYTLNSQQIKLLRQAYTIANKYKAIDGHRFGDTVCAIYLTESDAGKNIIGDVNKMLKGNNTILDASLGPGQIRLVTALEMMRNHPDMFPKQYLQLAHPDYYAYKKFVYYQHQIYKFRHILRLYKNKKGNRAYRVRKWAIRELNYYEYKNSLYWKYYKRYYYKDITIVNKLLSDYKFSIIITTAKLIDSYNYAYKHHMWNPWFKTISKYNGGWYNKKYYRRVILNMSIVRDLKQKGIIK